MGRCASRTGSARTNGLTDRMSAFAWLKEVHVALKDDKVLKRVGLAESKLFFNEDLKLRKGVGADFVFMGDAYGS